MFTFFSLSETVEDSISKERGRSSYKLCTCIKDVYENDRILSDVLDDARTH